MEMTNFEYIQFRIGYTFKNRGLLCQAFTRKSYTEENKNALNNEVLEFYGDKALDFIVMKKMSEYYGSIGVGNFFTSSLDEGKLTDIKKQLVCREMLASKIRQLDFQKRLILGKGDYMQKIWEQESVQEDLFESILGAVAIDSNWDIEALSVVVERMLNPEFYFKNGFGEEVDYVTLVQQWYQKKFGKIPKYSFNYPITVGTTVSHDINLSDDFICTLVDDVLFRKTIQASGSSKKAALNAAAKKIYQDIEKNNLFITLEDEVGKPNLERAVNQLQELYQKGYISEPQYTFLETYDNNGNPVWECWCYLQNLKQGFNGIHSSKKMAKKIAAYTMVCLYLGGTADEAERIAPK